MEILKAKERDKNSLHSVRKKRKMGLVPGVIYGSQIGNMLFEVGELELNKEISKLGEHGTIEMELNNKRVKALIREIQKEPVTKKIIHIDLQEIDKDKRIETEVPLLFSGSLPSSKEGIVQKEKSSVRVEGKYSDIPKFISVDVSKMDMNDVLRIRDLEISEEISFAEDLDTVVAVVTHIGTSGDSSDNNVDGSINTTTDKKPPEENK